MTNGKGNLMSYRGHFLDVIGSAFAFDGVDSSDLDDHLQIWGIEPVDAMQSVFIGPDGARRVVDAVTAIHRLATATDREAARWV